MPAFIFAQAAAATSDMDLSLSLNCNYKRALEGEELVKCPHCESLNTKFRFFNNHKENQPRYKCKDCGLTFTKNGKVRKRSKLMHVHEQEEQVLVMTQNIAHEETTEFEGLSPPNTWQRTLELDKLGSCLHCGSMDIKFRYFNNKKQSQARYLCRNCHKTFTRGGKLRSGTMKLVNSVQPTPRDYNVKSPIIGENFEASPPTLDQGCWDDYNVFDIQNETLLNIFTEEDAKLVEDWIGGLTLDQLIESDQTCAMGNSYMYEDQSRNMHTESLEATELPAIEDNLDNDYLLNIEDWQFTMEDLGKLDFLEDLLDSLESHSPNDTT